MNVNGISGGIDLARSIGRNASSGLGEPTRSLGAGEVRSHIASIQNDEGRSLFDIRDDLRGAVRSALQGFDGEGDPRTAVQDAIESTLESNGFDLGQVKGAMQDAGIGRLRSMINGEAGASPAGLDPASLLRDGGGEDLMIRQFLQQFRAGVNLDLQI